MKQVRGRVAKKPLKKARRLPYDYNERLVYLYLRDRATCQLCGGKVDWSLRDQFFHPGKPTIDHRQAKSKGGAKYAASNQQLAHLRCNQQKGTKTMKQLRAQRTQPSVRLQRAVRQPARRVVRPRSSSLADLLRR